MLLRRILRLPSTRSPLCLIAIYIRILWVIIVFWCELGVFYNALSTCHWPSTQSTYRDAHILLVADPQVLDRSSYPGRPRWLMAITQHIVDFNMRKSWHALKSKLKPDAVVFLGDMMDNGRWVNSKEEYEAYYNKFQSIFRHDNRTMPTFYLPGNHDVDLGRHTPDIVKSLARARYLTHFGPTNHRFVVHNTTFVFLDAPGIVDEYEVMINQLKKEDWKRYARKGGALSFLLNTVDDKPTGPIILFTHIPLHRPPISHSASSIPNPCGPLREHHKPIYKGRGHGYENLLPKPVSQFILQNLRPEVIFSGDDHDHCAYMHTWHLESTHSPARGAASPTTRTQSASSQLEQQQITIPEITVTSFSMAMGVQRPGFQLLSIPSSPPVSNSPSDLTSQRRTDMQALASSVAHLTSTSTTHKSQPLSRMPPPPPSANSDKVNLAGAGKTYLTSPCFLPSQIRIYSYVYVPLAILSFVSLLAAAALHELKGLRNDGAGGFLPVYSLVEGEPKGVASLTGAPKKLRLRTRGRRTWFVGAWVEAVKTVAFVMLWYAVVWCWISW